MTKFLFIAFCFFAIPTLISAQIPGGFIAKYQLDNNTATDIGGNNYNGSLTNTSATTNRFSNANSAIALNAGSSTGALPLALVTAVQNDFTMGFWFKTTMTASNSGSWYGGNALVDAEVCGGTTDWGVALIDGGAVSLGIGAPDITIKSPLNNYNDGAWHFVTATRNAAAGTIKLYMEGVQVAQSINTTTAALSAPNSIRMGSNPCAPSGVYTGSLDDIIFYSRVLTATDVAALYTNMNAFALPLKWISFSGKWQNNKAVLQWEVEAIANNNYFEIEHSKDGTNFYTTGRIENNVGSLDTNKTLFTYSDYNAVSNVSNYYRIKQVDLDGRFTYSKTVKLNADNSSVKKLHLRTNPVANELVLMNDDQIQVLQFEITDPTGRIIMISTLKNNSPIIRTNVQKLKAGFYTIKIYTSNATTVLPFIKQ